MLTASSLTILNNLPWHKPDEQRSIIEVLYGNFATAKRGEEINLDFSDEIVLLALEVFVWLLFNDYDNVSGLCTW